jgi:hypothetical protein
LDKRTGQIFRIRSDRSDSWWKTSLVKKFKSTNKFLFFVFIF